MAIRPVDYQILMPKVNDVAKMQNAEQHKLMSQVQQQADNTQKRTDKDMKSVHKQSEAQKSVIAEKQKDRKKNKKQGENEKEENNKEKATNEAKPQTRRTIDIRL